MNWINPLTKVPLRASYAAVLLLSLLLLWAAAPRVGAADNFADLSAAIQAANNGSGSRAITLSGDVVLSAALPPITGRVSIDGGGHSISGNDAYRIFDVIGGVLTLKNVTLTEGAAGEESGGAIRLRNGARAVIENSTLSNHQAKSGGAIFANGGRVSIKNSRFEANCTQLSTYALTSQGNDNDRRSVGADGCVRIDYVRTQIDADVQSDVDGGAIRLSNGAQANIESSTFSENRATYGGAISTAHSGVRLTVSKSSFVGNRASESGGALGGVWTGGGNISIDSSSFVENSAGRSDGGAIKALNHRLVITNSTFSNNKADDGGGAVKINEDSEVTITHVTFVENRANGRAATTIANSGGKATLRNSIIVGSGAGEDCVGVGEHAGNLSVDGTCGDSRSDDPRLGELTGSPAYYSLRDRSPAIDNADREFCLETDQIGTSRPHGGGCDIGAIEGRGATAAEPTPIPPLVCSLAHQIVAANRDRPSSGCPAGSGVDTIVLDKDIALFEPLPAITSHIIIEGNGHSISGEGKFRIFDVDGGVLTVKNLTIAEGRAGAGNGGAIRLQNNGRAAVRDSLFIDNRAQYGGAVFIAWTGTDRSSLTVNGSSFVNNGGSVIYAGGGTISIESSSFVKNSSVAIGMVNPFTRLDVVNSSFINNSSAVFAENGALANLTHVTICCHASPLRTAADAFTTSGRFNVRNSILVGAVSTGLCDSLRQNISNLIADGACSPRLSGEPGLAEAGDSSTHFELLPGSAAINAADMRFCPESDQLGRARSTFGRCDIGAIEAVPVSQAISSCTVTTTHLLNLRDGPGGNVIGGVPQNATVRAVARTSRWYEVEHEGASGWISADYVETAGECR